MANFPWEAAGEVASAILLLGGTYYMIVRHFKEKRARKMGLPANPTRCIDAEKRISALEISQATCTTKLVSLDEKVSDVQMDVKELLRLHIKP